MIPKNLNDITFEDIQLLKTEQVREGKTLEYKGQLPDDTKFLKGISALANTSGGDFIIGIQEHGGIPSEIQGIQISNLDEEILKLENKIRTGLEPRLVGHDIRPISVKDDYYVLIIRVPQSWNAPHRILKNSTFYARNSAGTYPLDVSELRLAFILSEQISDRIRNFRVDRIAKIGGNETPVPLAAGAKLLLHLIPLSAFTTQNRINIGAQQQSVASSLPTMGNATGSWYPIFNIDGIVNYSGNLNNNSRRAYTLLFRSGIIESVRVFTPSNGIKYIPSVSYEEDILKILPRYLKSLSELEIQLPFYLFFSFIDVKGYQLVVNSRLTRSDEQNEVDRNVLQLPEVVIDSFEEVNLAKVLKESFDMVWNAFGFARSFNYDEEGNWKSTR